MGSAGVVEVVDVSSERSPGFRHAGVSLQVDFLVFDRPPEPFDEDVVPPVPLPSMLMAISCFFFSTSVKAAPVNWLPWSELKISGLPCVARASSTSYGRKWVMGPIRRRG
jgi:hypothetical protein